MEMLEILLKTRQQQQNKINLKINQVTKAFEAFLNTNRVYFKYFLK